MTATRKQSERSSRRMTVSPTTKRLYLVAVLLAVSLAAFFTLRLAPSATPASDVVKQTLSPEAYNVMYRQGTEPPFSSPLDKEYRKGTYVTADTGLPVYRSEDKYDSRTGWPSFTKPIEGGVLLREDNSLFGNRIEVVSADTGAHLGHVFDDGPPPLGKRYCMNGVALRFVPD